MKVMNMMIVKMKKIHLIKNERDWNNPRYSIINLGQGLGKQMNGFSQYCNHINYISALLGYPTLIFYFDFRNRRFLLLETVRQV